MWKIKTNNPSSKNVRSASILAVLLGLLSLGAFAQTTVAAPIQVEDLFEDPRPIIDRDPYDRITFANGDSFLVEPIEIDNYKELPASGLAVFQLLAEPSDEYRYVTNWRNVKKIEKFGDIVFEEARRLEKTGNLTEAIRYYMFLKNHPMFEGNRIKIDFFPILAKDTKNSVEQRMYMDALAGFQELKKSFPTRFLNMNSRIKSIDDGLRFCYEKLLAKELSQKKYVSVRTRMNQMLALYPKATKKLHSEYVEKIRNEARVGLSRLQKALDAGKPLEAQDALRDMLAIAPDLPEAVELKRKIQKQYPMIMIGVDQHSVTRDPRQIESWSARRAGVMVRRQLMEFKKQDDDGGVYVCPIGRLEIVGDESLEYRFEILPQQPGSDVPSVSAIDLAFKLEAATNPKSDSYQPLWARVLKSVEVETPTSVRIRLRYPFLLPRALMQMPFLDTKLSGSDGPLKFEFLDKKLNRKVFQANPKYRVEAGRPRIVEQKISDSSEASRLLQEGAIDVLDTVHPGELERLQNDPNIVVRRYQIPSVHWLVPNFRNDWVSNPVFRRALLYAIDRERIVQQVLTNGKNIDGYEVISGPFPVGVTETDPLMYANNFKLKPLPYSRDMAKVFLKMSAKQVKGMQKRRAKLRGDAPVKPKLDKSNLDKKDGEPGKQDEDETLPEPPVIVLAHPNNLKAISICTLIKQQWGSVGIKTKLVPLPEGQVMPKNEDYDFVFVECTMQEPLVDARRIFGRHGLVKTIDGNVEQSLEYIDQVKNWQAAGNGLRRLHTQVYNKMSILPLWQVPQYYAHRPNIRNLGFEINTLYQNVKNWRFDLEEPRVAGQ